MTTVNSLAEELSGTWSLEAMVDGRKVTLWMDLEDDEAKLTGTLKGPDGRVYRMAAANIDDGHFWFVVRGEGILNMAEGIGVAEGGDLRLTLKTSRGEIRGRATRAE